MMPGSKAEARYHDDQQALEPCQEELHIRRSSCSDDVEACDQPGHRDSKHLLPQQLSKNRTRKESKNGEGSQNARQPSCDGRERSWLRNGNLRPHIEESGKVAVSLAQKRVF